MATWHSGDACGTTHCRGGWVTHLAGKDGAKLEAFYGMPLAAQIIYENSSPIKVNAFRYFEAADEAMKDMERCATEEKALVTATQSYPTTGSDEVPKIGL
jgi:hypothetical protein